MAEKIDFSAEIEEITGMSEQKFIKQWLDRNSEWSAMSHVEKSYLRGLKMMINDESVSWDEDQRNRRQASGRACLTLPMIADFVQKAHGDFCQTAPQVTVEPVDSEADVKTAEVYKGLIYATQYQSNGDQIHKDAAFYVLAGALAAWRANTRFLDQKTYNVEATLDQIVNPCALRWDLNANKPDLSDKKWIMLLKPVTKEEYIRDYGEENWLPNDITGTPGTSDENWFTKDRAMLAEAWWIQEESFTLYEHADGTADRTPPSAEEKSLYESQEKEENSRRPRKLRTRTAYDKKIWSCIIDGRKVLTEPVEWPDYTEEPIIPFLIATGRKIVIKGKVYFKSLISDGMDIQVLINYWITALTESGALQPDSPWIVTQGQIEGLPEWDDNTGKYKYLRYKQDPEFPQAAPPQRQSPPQMPLGMMQILEFLTQALRNSIGLQQASLGMNGNEQSGIAIQARQGQGDSSTFPIIENLQRQFELEAKILTNIYPTIMDTPRIERILGPDGKNSVAYLKQKHPDTGEVIDLKNGKYDTHISLGPMFATQRDEQKKMAIDFMQIMKATSPASAAALSPKLVDMMNLSNAEDWKKIIISTLPPNIQALYAQEAQVGNQVQLPPEMLAQMNQIAQQLQQARQLAQQQALEIEKLHRGDAVKLAEIQSKQGIEKEKANLEREKFMKDITLKEMEINNKYQIEMEKIEADVTLRALNLLEDAKSKREALISEHERIEREKKEVQTAPIDGSGIVGKAGNRPANNATNGQEPVPPIAQGSEGEAATINPSPAQGEQ